MTSKRSVLRLSGLFILLTLTLAMALGGPGGAWAKGKPPPKDEPPPEPVAWDEPEIVFVVRESDMDGLGVADRNGNHKVIIDPTLVHIDAPTWLPDGSGFLFASDRWGNGIHYATFSFGHDTDGAVDPDTFQVGPIQLVRETIATGGLSWPSASPIWSIGECILDHAGLPAGSDCKIFQILFGDRETDPAPYYSVYTTRMEIVLKVDGLPDSRFAPLMGDRTPLTPLPDNTVSWPTDAYPSWSRDGLQVVMESHLSHGPDGCQELCDFEQDIVVIENLDNPFDSRLSLVQEGAGTTIGKYPRHPRWANESDLIYLGATSYYPGTTRQEGGGAFDIWTLDLNGYPENITHNEEYTQFMPAVSPDDKLIVYRRSGASQDCGDKGKRQPTILEIRAADDRSLCGGSTLVELETGRWPNRPHWFVEGTWVDSTGPDWPYLN